MKFNTLTSDQQKALKMLNKEKICILKGYSGSGKSYLINHFQKQNKHKNIVLTAPTHKAVSILNGDYTIHAYLGLILQWYEDKQVLVSKAHTAKVQKNDILIIDEVSMLNTEILDHIDRAIEQFHLKVIFVGDNAQIPPVNESISPIWNRDYPSFTLNEIVRQAKDNPIIQMSYDIRQGKMNPFQSYINPPKIMMGNLQEMKNFYLEYYESTTILSYRNSIVDKANTWARNLIKNNPKEKFLIGEKVYIRSVSKDQIHKLEDIATIVEVSEPVSYPPYDFNIQRIIIESEKGTEIMLVPYDEKDVAKINTNKKKLVDMAKKNQIKWEEYYNFVESFGDLKKIYSMTVHRSQGSTFQNVIVNIDDIKDRNMLYTAITRASDKVFLFTHK